MKFRYLALMLMIFLVRCETSVEEKPEIINSEHLSHLYESWDANGSDLGGIWIYCEAPDYHLVTDEDEGFTCVDDVARALVFYCRAYKSTESTDVLEKIKSLIAFILYMQAENDFFYNFVFPDKSINRTHQNSVSEANWWSWRAIWSLTEVLALENKDLAEIQTMVLESVRKLIPYMLTICSDASSTFDVDGISVPLCAKDLGGDQIALIMIGLSNYYQIYPSPEIESQLINLGNVLIKTQYGDENTFPHGAFLSWQNIWHAWGNSQAYAMLKVGRQLDHRRFIDSGLKEVSNFYSYYLENRPSHFEIKQSNDSLIILDSSQFPQIAYNLRPMIFATLEAWEITQGDEYKSLAVDLGSWFFGHNQANYKMYDKDTGRTFDGIISKDEINRNSGAESTIEALLSIQAISEYPPLLTEITKSKNGI